MSDEAVQVVTRGIVSKDTRQTQGGRRELCRAGYLEGMLGSAEGGRFWKKGVG